MQWVGMGSMVKQSKKDTMCKAYVSVKENALTTNVYSAWQVQKAKDEAQQAC